MLIHTSLWKQLHVHRRFAVQFLSLLVATHGSFILATSLLDQLAAHRGSHLTDIVIDIPLLIGLGLLYLATLLRRRKHNAWQVTLLAYIFYFGLTLSDVLMRFGTHDVDSLRIIRNLVIPAIVLLLLVVFRREFVVKSDQQGFRWALRFVVGLFIVTFLYGVTGFCLLDTSDFHQEIGLATAAHYTIDQFDLTTNRPLHPATKRAHLFVDSLSFVSTAAVVYAVISFFQPLRMRWTDQTQNREHMTRLLTDYPAHSEDFFKLWPHDKQFFFDDQGESGLAYHVYHGVALCLADPAGDPQRFPALLQAFEEQCFNNDWLPALVNCEQTALYTRAGYETQKIGEEAVVELNHFESEVVRNKYFRHIRNKFTKQGFTAELLQPPHHQAVLERLRAISNEWLEVSGRAERKFTLGYHTDNYLQQCPVMVVRDAASTIQAFANVVPASFDRQEATFDMLRHAHHSPSNINDFLLINLAENLQADGYQHLNMGMCPLIGLDDVPASNRTVIDAFLRFAYANGDRFFSFNGLHRFKAKYEPVWRDRYVAYKGGVRGFSRTTNALMQIMRVKS